MASPAVERLKPLYENHARGEFFLDDDLWHPDIEMVFTEEFPEPGSYQGLERFPEAFSVWLRAWERWEVHLEELEVAPDGRIVAWVRFAGYGRGSGVPVETLGAQVWTFDEPSGLATRLEIHASRDAARAILAG
jgi:ketosteroid isomerase-like protein